MDNRQFFTQQKNIKRRMDEKDLNIAIGQGANLAIQLIVGKNISYLQDEVGQKDLVKSLAKPIVEAIFELRNEYAPEKEDARAV